MTINCRRVLAGLLTLCLLALTGCGGDKYADARSLMEDQTRVTEDYVNGLEKADSAEAAARVIDDFTDGMKELMPRIKAFQEQYPELAGQSAPADAPRDVQEGMQRLQEASARIQSATMKMMKFMLDPKVQQALQRMGTELGALGQS